MVGYWLHLSHKRVASTGLALLVRPPLRRGSISDELSDAWDLPRPKGNYGGMSEAELQVMSWLQTNLQDIIAAEQRWRIDRRAIAGAIAWEALMNAKPDAPGRWSRKGPF